MSVFDVYFYNHIFFVIIISAGNKLNRYCRLQQYNPGRLEECALSAEKDEFKVVGKRGSLISIRKEF